MRPTLQDPCVPYQATGVSVRLQTSEQGIWSLHLPPSTLNHWPSGLHTN